MPRPATIGSIFVVTLALLDSSGRSALAKKSPPAPIDSKVIAAKRFFETGEFLYNRGDFLDAAKEFERAYAEDARPRLLYNLASAYDKGGDRKKAVAAYRAYCDGKSEGQEDEQAKQLARARADVLQKELNELEAARAAALRPVEQRKLPPSLPYVEPVTKQTFQTMVEVDGKPYTMLGAGARKVSLFKVYAMALYVEDEPARKLFPAFAARAGGSDKETLMRDDLAFEFLILGEFGKMAQLRFVRAVTAKQTRDAYREALADDLSSAAPAQLKQDTEAFLALFDDVRENESVIIRTRADGMIVVELAGKRKPGPTNLRLSHDLWTIWLGHKPISSDLKKNLIDRIDTLAR
ncbi:MAG: chalcone isomerase family protein [Polyangia bacterium]